MGPWEGPHRQVLARAGRDSSPLGGGGLGKGGGQEGGGRETVAQHPTGPHASSRGPPFRCQVAPITTSPPAAMLAAIRFPARASRRTAWFATGIRASLLPPSGPRFRGA